MLNVVTAEGAKVFSEARKITNKDEQDISTFDRDEEKTYLEREREESELPEYDIFADYAEMVVQAYPIPTKIDISMAT